MITKENYDYLKEHYGRIASWAIWMPASDRPKSNTEDLSVFSDENIIQKLNPHYVFVGLNASEQQATENVWRSFHSDNPHQQDYKLRHALIGTKFWGSYITDIIKNYPKTDLSKEMPYLLKNPEVLNSHVQTFLDELAHIGPSPILIAMGGKTYDLLKSRKELQSYKIVKIMHYAYTINIDKYRQAVLSSLENL